MANQPIARQRREPLRPVGCSVEDSLIQSEHQNEVNGIVFCFFFENLGPFGKIISNLCSIFTNIMYKLYNHVASSDQTIE